MTKPMTIDPRRIAHELTTAMREVISEIDRAGFIVGHRGTLRALARRGLCGHPRYDTAKVTDLGRAVHAALHEESYGPWAMVDEGIGSLSFTMGELLDGRESEFDLPALFYAFVAAINAALPEGVALDEEGHEFFGPSPVPATAEDDIRTAVDSVDFEALAERHRKS